MPITINQMVGFETGGFDECDLIVSAPTVSTGTAASGEFKAVCHALSSDYIRVKMEKADAGGFFYAAAKIYCSNNTPSANYYFMPFVGGNASLSRLVWRTDGGIRMNSDSGNYDSTNAGIIATGQWNTIEFYQSGFTGSDAVKLWVNNALEMDFTGVNLGTQRYTSFAIRSGAQNYADFYVDDMIIMTGTDFQRLTSQAKIEVYRPTFNGATDNGDTLDSGVWTDTVSSTGTATYTSGGGAKAGTTDIDGDTNGAGAPSYIGPNRDLKLRGSYVAACKWMYFPYRTGLTGSVFVRGGGTVGGTSDGDPGITETPGDFFDIMSDYQDAGMCDYGEYFRMGMGTDGGSSISMIAMMGTILHVDNDFTVRRVIT